MLENFLPYVLATIVFFLALVLLSPAPSKTVAVAAHDLNAGHILVRSDLTLQAMPKIAVADDALTNIKAAHGQRSRNYVGTHHLLATSENEVGGESPLVSRRTAKAESVATAG